MHPRSRRDIFRNAKEFKTISRYRIAVQHQNLKFLPAIWVKPEISFLPRTTCLHSDKRANSGGIGFLKGTCLQIIVVSISIKLFIFRDSTIQPRAYAGSHGTSSHIQRQGDRRHIQHHTTLKRVRVVGNSARLIVVLPTHFLPQSTQLRI